MILPQALRLAIPAWSNEPVSLLKSTAVVYLPDAFLRWLERASRIPGFEMEGRKA